MKKSVWQYCLIWIRMARLETGICIRMGKGRQLLFMEALLRARSLVNQFAMSFHFILMTNL